MIDAQESAAQRNDGERVRAKTLAPHRQAQRDSPQLLQPGAPQPGAHRGAANYVGRHLWGTSRHTLALPQTTRDTCLSPQGGKMLAASRREGSPRPGGGSHPSGRWGRGGPSASLQAAACLVCGEAFPTPGEAPVAGAYSSLAAERILLAEARQAPRTCASLLIVSFPRRRRPCASEEFFSLNQILGLMIEAAPSEAPRDMVGRKGNSFCLRVADSGVRGWGVGVPRTCGRDRLGNVGERSLQDVCAGCTPNA